MKEASEKVLRKIRALLARADEARNDNEHERKIAMRQATKLMDEYSISLSQAMSDEDARDVGEYIVGSQRWKSMAVAAVGRLYGCKVYSVGKGPGKRCMVVGRESARVVVMELSKYVHKSIEREAKQFRGYGRGFIVSFKVGAASGVTHQVDALIRDRAAGETVSDSKAMVIVDYYKNELARNEAYIKNELGITLRSGGRTTASNRTAYWQGREYGSSLSLNNQIKSSGGQRLIK